jgi:hypothetical protein
MSDEPDLLQLLDRLIDEDRRFLERAQSVLARAGLARGSTPLAGERSQQPATEQARTAAPSAETVASGTATPADPAP